MKRITLIVLSLILLVVGLAAFKTARAQRADENEAGREQWEYLVVSAPQSTNFSASSSSGMRKEPNGGFNREEFVVEQQMDKLGAKGWELVSVSGHPSDPIYYFKRRK